MHNILKLHPKDNVAVLTADLLKGDEIKGSSIDLVAEKQLSLGDKVALTHLPKGELVYKYGIAIGSTTEDIALGGWVHLHNMQSDYVATYVFNGSDKQA